MIGEWGRKGMIGGGWLGERVKSLAGWLGERVKSLAGWLGERVKSLAGWLGERVKSLAVFWSFVIIVVCLFLRLFVFFLSSSPFFFVGLF